MGRRHVDMATRILKLKERIDLEKTKLHKDEGKLESLMIQLEEEFDMTTVIKAQTLLSKITKQISTLTNKLEEDMASLEETYDI